jgi:DNA-directed RNA polymerase subunit M/transcription elongation factor TFIIS
MENHFCDNCNNSMYIFMDKEELKLYEVCKACNNKVEYSGNLIYDNDFNIDLSESINNNKFIAYDLTLPHIHSQNIKCPNSECVSIVENYKESDIIYIKYDKDNMKYIYSCNYCGQKWTNN